MRLHATHFTLHGLVRALSQCIAGVKLCRHTHASFWQLIPDSVNSMIPAWNFLLTLKAQALPAPQTIIDVGANKSQMTKLLLLSATPNAIVLSFEPNPELRPIGKIYPTALSDKNGLAEFYLPADDIYWGTLVEAKEGVTTSTKSFEVKTARFDTLVNAGEVRLSELPRPILVKIDTEGSEKKVLDGFGTTLHEIDMLLVEVENIESRGRSYNLLTLATYLATYGFKNAKILYACFDGPTAPAYADILFWK